MDKLEELARALYMAKRAEYEAKDKRIACEDAIASLIDTADNGSKTVKAGGLKVTVKRALKYEADIAAIRELGETEMPNGLTLPLKFVPETYEFDAKSYERIHDIDPVAFKRLSQFVTVTPRKVSVTLGLA